MFEHRLFSAMASNNQYLLVVRGFCIICTQNSSRRERNSLVFLIKDTNILLDKYIGMRYNNIYQHQKGDHQNVDCSLREQENREGRAV